MFLYGDPHHPTRIRTYELSLADLKSLLNTDAATPNNQIRIHMAMYSDFGGYGVIGQNRPTFTPIMDSFHLDPGQVEHPTFYTMTGNSKKLTPITNNSLQPQLLPSSSNHEEEISKWKHRLK